MHLQGSGCRPDNFDPDCSDCPFQYVPKFYTKWFRIFEHNMIGDHVQMMQLDLEFAGLTFADVKYCEADWNRLVAEYERVTNTRFEEPEGQ